MSLYLRWWSYATFWAFPLSAFAIPTVSPLPNVTITTRSQSVLIYGSGFQEATPVKACIRTGKEAKGDRGTCLNVTIRNSQITPQVSLPMGTGQTGAAGQTSTPSPFASSSQVLTFKIPPDQTTGDYLIFIDQGDQEIAVPGALRIQPDDLGRITLDSIAPSTVYPDKDQKTFDFTIAGQNLAQQANDNTLISTNRGPFAIGTDAECDNYREAGVYKKVCLSYDQGLEGQKLKVSGYQPDMYEGPASLQIKVGNNISNSVKVTFSGVRAEVLRWLAIVLFLAFACTTFLLVLRGIRLSRLAGEETGALAAFFLDRQTNSFSLSKFQLIAWTAVAVFGYVYLFLCRNYVQWNSSLPPLPDNLPTLLGISAGTTVAAIGITVNRGSKGAGPLHPSLADFISTGGLVAGERFQFFIWTLVGCMGFVGVILHADPAALTQLPTIDGNLLTLMGISSAGYLAGKLVRQPGPIIDLITITDVIPPAETTPKADEGAARVRNLPSFTPKDEYPHAPAEMNPAIIKIEIKGQNLSEDALVKIGQEELRIDQFSMVGDSQSQQTGTSFFTKMYVTLLDAEEYRTGSHVLYLVNQDGQSACETFPLNPLSIDRNQQIAKGDVATTVVIAGKNFADKLKGSWTAPGATYSTPITEADIKLVDENHVTVLLVPGQAGTGRLVLETGIHLLGAANVIVA